MEHWPSLCVQDAAGLVVGRMEGPSHRASDAGPSDSGELLTQVCTCPIRNHGAIEERMPSSVQGKSDAPRRLVSDEEAVVIPESAHPTDDTPTVISKTQ